MQRLERGKFGTRVKLYYLRHVRTYLYCTYTCKVGSFLVFPSPGKEGGRTEERGGGRGKSDLCRARQVKKIPRWKEKTFSLLFSAPPVSLLRKSKREKEGRVFFYSCSSTTTVIPPLPPPPPPPCYLCYS